MAKQQTAFSKAVVVHAGARDGYQVALALHEAGLLDKLVTDLFWPADNQFANKAASIEPHLHRMLLQRSAKGLAPALVETKAVYGIATLLAEKMPRISPDRRRDIHRASDAALGKAAGKRARRYNQGLVSYSYYGFDAMQQFQQPTMLFQVHPHPASVRRLLQQELQRHPECAESLCQEWELALPDEEFSHLVRETEMASRFIAASSFTKNTLVEHGIAEGTIDVVPYGVDLDRFHPAAPGSSQSQPKLKLLFVGRINQRKGIKYLLDAIRLLDTKEIHLTVCGRVVDSLSLFQDNGIEVEVRPSVSHEELLAAYQSADLFVFPSVAEGFGLVLLEALACGLPILSTTHTAAPDLITNGVEGFIIEPQRVDLLAGAIEWCLNHRKELAAMKTSARRKAEQFTWARFRTQVACAVSKYLEQEFASVRLGGNA